jgi:probable O-glycosylation ligase (exosortase A-associated)
MPLRDLAVTAIVFALLPVILMKPWVGVLTWTWLGFMNPHRLGWGFAFDMQFALLVALATLVGMLLSREPKRIPWTRETVTLLIFIAWMVFTTFFAFYPVLAWPQLEKVLKIQLMIFVALILMQDEKRLRWLVWTIALSIGFYGVKGGIFTITYGGSFHVRGPPGTFIGGDNEMGLALVMTIPLLRYCQLNTSRRWARWAFGLAILLSAIAAVGSQSRGAFLALAAMAVFLWLKSRHKILTAVLIALAAVPIALVMPQEWYDRMASIRNYEEDASALGRINSWKMAINLAADRPTGGGFEAFRWETFARYAPEPNRVHDAHSIYFEVLGEHGFVGLALFLALGIMIWFTASSVIRKARASPETRWLADLVGMVQVSLVGYAAGGAFLGLAYFDFYYNLIVIVVLAKILLLRRLAQAKSAARPAPRTATGRVAPAAQPIASTLRRGT